MALVIAALALCGWLVSSQTLNAQNTSMPLATERQALDLANRKEWSSAEETARAILARNPDSFPALIILARSLRAQGAVAEARLVAARANRLADTDEERYVAAIEIATADYRQEHLLAAQYWLRRAVEFAPTQQMRDTAARNVQQVRAKSPWAFNFQFGVAPSSNVNNGSLAETVDIWGQAFTLNPDAKALSGLETTGQIAARYRFGGDSPYASYVSFSLYTRQVSLSAKARAEAPDVSGSDFNYDAFEFGYGHSFSKPSDPYRYRFDGAVGRSYYGDEPLSRYVRAAFTTSWGNPAQSVSSLRLVAERQWRDDDYERSAWITQASLQRVWLLSGGAKMHASAALRRTSSESIEIDHNAALASIGYQSGTILDGFATLGTSLGFEARDYPASPYRVGGRHDRRGFLTFEIGFPKIDYYGFSPTLGVEAQKVESDVDLYDTESVSLRLRVRSSF